MMKRLFYWALCLLLFAACGEDSDVEKDDPQETTLEVSATDLVFEAAGGVKTFTVTCNGEWKLEGAGEWCSVDADAGNGNHTVSVTAAVYDGMEDRNMNLTVKAGTQVKTVGVTQKHKDAIVLSKDKHDIPLSGGTLEVELKKDIDYEVTIPDECSSWISREPDTKATATHSFRFRIEPNDTPESRKGYIIFIGNAVKDTIYVYQTQEDRLLLEKGTYEISKKGETITVELKPNVDYDVLLPDGVDWVCHIETHTLRTDRLTFTIAENTTDNIRTTEVVIKDRNSHLSDTLHLTQNGGKTEGDDRDITAEIDAEFAKILQEKGYIPDAAKILWADVRYIDSLDIYAGKDTFQLASLQGIEYFESLTYLDCGYNRLSSLDISKNIALTELSCYGNKLTSLDVSKNTALAILDCFYNQLTTLDISKNTKLTILDCSDNQLTSLDISKNTALTALGCSENQLSTLDISKHTDLTILDCYENQLTSLDITQNTLLTELYCHDNPGSEGVFLLTVWPEENNNFYIEKETWDYNGQTITLKKHKALSESTYTETVNGVSFEMIPVKGGTFTQGVGMGGGGFEVTVEDYYIGKYEVTQGLWKAVMGTTVEEQRDKAGEPEEELYGVGDNYPMYYVNWDEAQEFVKKLNTLTGRTYALPTEAQWEYAALGGEKANGYTYSGSNTIGDVAWYGGNSSMKSHPVGGKASNELGIYDMSGNVFEWCADGDAEERIVRGGSWSCNAESAKVVNRFGKSPNSRFANYGFRIVLLP